MFVFVQVILKSCGAIAQLLPASSRFRGATKYYAAYWMKEKSPCLKSKDDGIQKPRGTTSIYPAKQDLNDTFEKMSRRYNGLPVAAYSFHFGTPLANVFKNDVPHLSSPGSFLYAVSFFTCFGHSV